MYDTIIIFILIFRKYLKVLILILIVILKYHYWKLIVKLQLVLVYLNFKQYYFMVKIYLYVGTYLLNLIFLG